MELKTPAKTIYVELGKKRRHCTKCYEPIPKNEHHLRIKTWSDQPAFTVNICEGCMKHLLIETIDKNVRR